MHLKSLQIWSICGFLATFNRRRVFKIVGIQYDRKIDHYRTTQVNEIVELTHSVTTDITGNKKGQGEKKSHLSASVVRTGIELTL